MTLFKDHKISAKELLNVIPNDIIEQIAVTTSVDHYSKVLKGKKMFYLLLYGILENDRLSQRTLEDTFNDSIFKMLFELDQNQSVRRSSISERLSRINSDYFKQIYDTIYELFSKQYSLKESHKYNLIRVDSSMVSDLSGHMEQGLKNNKRKKAVKYSVAFDGLLPCGATIFNETTYSNEDMALPEAVKSHVMQHSNHSNIYILDRGLQSSRNMASFCDNNINFVARLKENRKYVELESLTDSNNAVKQFDGLNLLTDSRVYLYTRKASNNSFKNAVLEQELRLIVVEKQRDTSQKYWFVTNDFDISAQEVATYYKRRWDIEVFFRFIKQELNVSHLVSLNKNGIEVMLYMTLIAAMLILIYKKENNIGYKTAKRRFTMEIRNNAIAIIVELCGGDPNIFFKTGIFRP